MPPVSDLLPAGPMPMLLLSGAAAAFCVLWLRERRRSRKELQKNTEELLALHDAGLEIYGELDLTVVLQKVVDRARTMMNVRYAALSVTSGENVIESFLTSGLSEEQRNRIGAPPRGHGLLGLTLNRGERLRLQDLGSDPRSGGFPPNHPPMRSLLAVPIVCDSPFRGNLYVAEKIGAAAFTAAEEESLARLAAKAARAIDTSRQHQKLNDVAIFEERLHIAHELHDGMVQMLAYVNAKAQAAREFLTSGRQEEGLAQLSQLASVAREVYADAREGILGLRTSIADGQSTAAGVRHFVELWQEQSAIPVVLEVDATIEVDPRTALQLIRVLQEALANVRKHARATRVTVRLQRSAQALVLTVEDDGCGFDAGVLSAKSADNFGLATMRERVVSVGGALTVETSPGRGTRLDMRLPARAEGRERQLPA